MSKEIIIEKLRDIICDYIDVDRNLISGDMSISSELGIDSFGLISMICSIEDCFDIKIAENELMGFQTINDMVDYIGQAVA